MSYTETFFINRIGDQTFLCVYSVFIENNYSYDKKDTYRLDCKIF